MLVRDLPFKVQSGNHFWQDTDVLLDGPGLSVHIEKPTENNPNIQYRNRYWVGLRNSSELGARWHGTSADGLDEFEAQAILDHYIQEYGLKNK
jgi:hypothetical protein